MKIKYTKEYSYYRKGTFIIKRIDPNNFHFYVDDYIYPNREIIFGKDEVLFWKDDEIDKQYKELFI